MPRNIVDQGSLMADHGRICLLLANLLAWTVTALGAQAAEAQVLSKLLLTTADAWPSYVRGKGQYQWILTPRALRNGVTYLGSNERLRVVLDRWKKDGGNLTIATVGGSITAGQGCPDAPNYPQYVENYMQDYYGASVAVSNGAVGGTVSSYMSLCHNVHVPKTADIIFVEYNQNDHGVVMPQFMNNQRRSYERLLRKLLSYPRQPAVILMHSYSWGLPDYPPGTYWSSAQADHDMFAHYYQLPALSVKACCYHLMQQGVAGFWVNETRNKDEARLANKAFFYDNLHPDGRTGARVMAELAVHLIESTLVGAAAQPVTEADLIAAALPLPPPMVPDNHHSLHDQCFMGASFTRTVTRKEGFEWVNEAKGPRSKWGMVATQVGSILELTLDTRASAHATLVTPGLSRIEPAGIEAAAAAAADAVEGSASNKRDMLLELAYLQSYENMGTADVSCVSGCSCEAQVLDGHSTHHSSQLHMLDMLVTQHQHCVVRVQVRNATSSGNHKVKVSACIVSEEAGWKTGIQNHRAVEYVHDISFRSKDNAFDVRNHVRRTWRMAAT